MRSPVGPIREVPSSRATLALLLKEIASLAKLAGAPLPEDIEANIMNQIESLAYPMKSSMQRDMEKLVQVEADHLQGFLLEIAKLEGISVPVLEAVYGNLKVYELQLQAQ